MLAADNTNLVGAYIAIGIIGYLLVAFAYVGIFRKAGQPAWAGFVPIVNIYFLLKVVGRPGWWLLIILLVPCVGFIFLLVAEYDLAKSFGHGVGMWLGIVFLPIIFLYVLGYGGSEYRGPVAAPAA